MEIVLILLVVISTLLVAGLTLAQSGEPPAPGRPAPDFRLQALGGEERTLRALSGRRAVLVFHPQDETPECIAFLERFKAIAPQLEAAGASLSTVVVSKAGAADAYARAHGIGIGMTVLCDPEGKAAKAYGALVNLGFMKFARKLTVLVDAHGVVVRSWRDVPGPQHAEELLKALGVPPR
jgi:peroxiredoxin Q/BCP